MASGNNNSTSKIATIVVLIPILAALWYAAPWILPVWWWQNVDVEAIAKAHAEEGYTQKSLQTEFNFVVFYNPRGGRGSKDPCPFQVVTCTPSWQSVYPKGENEDQLLVRVSLVDERDGEPIGKVWIGVNPEEAFFKIRGYRLPPGSCGKPKGRPVVVFKGLSMEKLDISQGMSMKNSAQSWENDDLWEDRDDGFSK